MDDVKVEAGQHVHAETSCLHYAPGFFDRRNWITGISEFDGS
jgi:hypothetical protein